MFKRWLYILRILSLGVKNFRNLTTQTIQFCDGLNVLCGKNAQGKTNTLEAIYLSTIGKSPKTRRDSEMISFSHGHLEVVLRFEHLGSEKTIKMDINHKQKSVFLNDVKLKKLSDVIGNFGSVYFSPEELNLIKAGPSHRRRFLDIVLCQQDKTYLKDLQMFQKILIQRNAALKKENQQKQIFVWDKWICDVTKKLYEKRKKFVEKLNEVIKPIHQNLSDKKEDLEIIYDSQINEQNISKIGEELEKTLEKDIILGYTSFGIQNDDLIFKINKKDVKKHASQGQQRTVVLSLKLAEMEILKQDYGSYPVLLLDDVLSELDKDRRQKLCENLKNIQCILTCTEFLEDLPCKKFCVESGKVEEK